MKVEIETKTMLQAGGALVFMFLFGGVCFAVGGWYSLMYHSEDIAVPVDCLSGDYNSLVAAPFFAGHCAQLGLVPSVIVQDVNGSVFGQPICVETQEVR